MFYDWTGKSGRAYKSDVQPINTLFEEVGGVYVLCKPAPGDEWDALEAGETDSFCRSLTCQAARLIARVECTHVGVIPLSDSVDRQVVLSDLASLVGGNLR